MKVWAGLASPETLGWAWRSIFSLCPHMGISGCLSVSLSLPIKDTGPIGLGPIPVTLYLD